MVSNKCHQNLVSDRTDRQTDAISIFWALIVIKTKFGIINVLELRMILYARSRFYKTKVLIVEP